jgi:hypothetical protein
VYFTVLKINYLYGLKKKKFKEKKLTQKNRIERNTFPIKEVTHRLSNNIWSSLEGTLQSSTT